MDYKDLMGLAVNCESEYDLARHFFRWHCRLQRIMRRPLSMQKNTTISV